MKAQDKLPVALFHRAYHGYTGGHGKVWDYFNHVNASGLYRPRIFFTPDSLMDENNPWSNSQSMFEKEWHPETTDLLFIAGLDWHAVPETLPASIPVINLIQGIRHADPSLSLYNFLSRRAVRICVSQPVADAILATGRVNGPVFVIPNGIELPQPVLPEERTNAVFVGALKNKQLGIDLAEKLRVQGYEVDLLIDYVPRSEYLVRLGKARLAVLLPLQAEGFYLPGLEAMALGTPVIMPDCVGNREYTNHGVNCLIVTPADIIENIHRLDDQLVWMGFHAAGLKTVQRHTISQERDSFLRILKRIMDHK